MIDSLDLSTLNWTVSGWTPLAWRLARSMEIGAEPLEEISPVPANVPGSVLRSRLVSQLCV